MHAILRPFLLLMFLAWPAAAQEVALPEAQARIDLGTEFHFYGPDDTRRIVTQEWGNPPTEADGALGLVMPNEPAPDWGALVRWEPLGWVSAEQAREADYAALMRQMQAETLAANAGRRAAGFPAATLRGWAQPPRYDSVRHAVTWGRTLRFSDGDEDVLHYDLRLLGRRGVLSLNMVGELDDLPKIRAAADVLAARTRFDPGARYEDFDAARDEAAGYGIAGLIASGAGLAVAKNVGLLAILAKFAQPLGAALLILAAALLTPFRRLFGSRKKPVTR